MRTRAALAATTFLITAASVANGATTPATVGPTPARNGSGLPITLALPDGEARATVWHVPPVGPSVPPGNTLRETYGPLREAALAGDIPSAWALGKGLERCARSRRSGELGQRDAAWCAGITPEQTVEADRWKRRAVDAGHMAALMDVVGGTTTRDTPEAGVVAKRLWAEGHISALPALSRAAERGLLSGEADRVTAYAYRRLSHAFMSVHQANSKADWVRYNLQLESEYLRQKLGEMSPGESATAVRLTRELLEQNGNCCLWP